MWRVKTAGFTLIEIVIAVTILVLIGALLFSAFRTFSTRHTLDGAAMEVRSVLAEARAQTLESLNDSAYGVHIQSDRLVLFKGTTYVANDANNRTILMSSRITLSTSLTPSGSDVLFQRLTGKATQTGTVTVTLKSDATQTRTITITQSGLSS